jgi:hypothetical protein
MTCHRPHPDKGEVIIRADRLDELERKERAHDDYLTALRRLRATAPQGQAGYRQAMMDMARYITDAAARRLDTHPS